MYLLIACAGSWLVLLGSFFTAWEQLPQPRTTSDVVVIVIIGAGVLLFARIGLISLLALLLRLLPSGRFRSALTGVVVRAMPRILASSVLAVVSAGLAVHSAQAAPVVHFEPEPTSTTQASSAPADPGWPTIDDDEPSADSPDSTERADEAEPPEDVESPDRARPPDPGWPTEPPSGRSPESPPANGPADEPRESDQTDEPDRSKNANEPDADITVPEDSGTATHVVTQGESLWSIAADLTDAPAEIPKIVADVYAANEDIIGPDPSLILAGQRLEIQK